MNERSWSTRGPRPRREREPEADAELRAELGPLVEPEAAAVPHLDPVVGEADQRRRRATASSTRSPDAREGARRGPTCAARVADQATATTIAIPPIVGVPALAM